MMAGENSVRQWWLIIRRDGHAIRKLKVNVSLIRDGSDLERLVELEQVSPDFDIIDVVSGFNNDDLLLVGTYELVSTTSSFEINNIE